jgi:hypothetical protein
LILALADARFVDPAAGDLHLKATSAVLPRNLRIP